MRGLFRAQTRALFGLFGGRLDLSRSAQPRGTVPITVKLLMNGPAIAGFLIIAP